MATAPTTTKKAPAKKAAAKKTVKKTAAAASKKKVTKAGAFAVIATGGKQYLVRPGDVIDDVLLMDDGSMTKIGTPMIAGTKISAEFIEAGRGKKIDVIQFKQKSRYYKKKGHRQPFMKFKISSF